MDLESADTINTQPEAEAQPAAARLCPKCGLSVPIFVSSCPKDGTLIDDTLGEGRKLVGNYEFLEFVGSGGMGVIYKAKHPVMKRVVAIKMLHSHLMNETITRRFQQEAEAVSGLSHKCIIAVHDYGVSEHGQPYMVMEYIDGKPLSDLVRQGPMPMDAAINIGIQLAHALQHAHEKGVLHRDLKPSNIMVTDYDCSFPEVKIVDFGIAKILQADKTKVTQTGELLGTPQYMSPEQCRGHELDARSDIYSLGCVMFETMTGKPPFGGSTMVSTIVEQISKPARTLREVRPDMTFPARLEDLMAKALAKDPADRYQSMSELLTDLNEVQSIVAREDEFKIGTARALRLNKEERHLLLISVAAGLSLLGVAACTMMFINMVNQALIGKAPNSKQTAEMEAANADRLIFLERQKTVRFLDPRRLDDHFVKTYFNTDLGITALDLAGSHITDKSMPSVALQKGIHFITFDNTQITDVGIAYLRMLHDLLELHVDRTGLTDKGMAYIAEIKSLKNLSVRGNAITDDGVKAISGLRLRSLFLSGTSVTDETLKVLSSMKDLQRLSFRSCGKISGSGLKYLLELPTLQYLDFENCYLSPEGIESLGQMKHLIALEFGHTRLTADGINKLSRIQTLEYLNLNGSTVDSAWIEALSKLPRLRSLVLNVCRIDPRAIAMIPEHLPNLTQLQMRYSPLTDKAIEPLKGLKDLQFLDMERSGVSAEGAVKLKRELGRPDLQIRY